MVKEKPVPIIFKVIVAVLATSIKTVAAKDATFDVAVSVADLLLPGISVPPF